MKRQRVILVLTALLLAAGITALALYAEPVQIVQPPTEQNGSFTVSWPASGGKEITPLSSGVSFSSPVPSAAPSAKDDSSAISVLSSGKPPEERDITPWEVISARNDAAGRAFWHYKRGIAGGRTEPGRHFGGGEAAAVRH